MVNTDCVKGVLLKVFHSADNSQIFFGPFLSFHSKFSGYFSNLVWNAISDKNRYFLINGRDFHDDRSRFDYACSRFS